MPVNDTTTNQGYQKPNIANTLADDVGRLRSALDAIDTDIASKAPSAGPTFTGVTTVDAGSAAAPSLTFTGATTATGIYSPGADKLAISTAGADRLFIDAAGLVGIGITPIVPFDAKGRAILGGLSTRVDENYDLQVQSAGNVELKLQSGATNTSYLAFGTTSDALSTGFSVANADGALRIRTNNTEQARIDISGRLLLGTSSDSGGALLQVNSDRIRVGTAKTPASSTATGTTGEICWDASYVYVCTATNTWKRAALSTW